MSTYKPNLKEASDSSNNTPEQLLYNSNRDKTIIKLREWLGNQNWINDGILSFETSVRGMKQNEIMVLIHGTNSKIEDILKTLRTTNFKSLGMNMEYISYEQASWNNSTYFIDFDFIG